MILVLQPDVAPAVRLPRMRGDDPNAAEKINDGMLFAPHARG